MAKLTITPSTVAVDNVSNLANQVKGQATTVKLAMDQYGIDDKNYTNEVLISELNGNSGSYKIGHNSNSINSDNVGDALEENRQLINTLEVSDTENVKITGNQTISGTKTFSSNVVVPVTPTSTTHATSKGYVDTGLNTKADDDSVVKLSGNQSISGTKTFSSIPIITSQPTSPTHAANKSYVDSVTAGVILGQIPDNSLTDDKLVDEGGIKSAVYNSFRLSPNDAIGNVKTVDDGQNISLWTSAGTTTVTADTTNFKIRNQSIRITETDNTSGYCGAIKNNISIDLSKLNSGEDSTDEDFIVIPIFISDSTYVLQLLFLFSQDSTYSGTNIKSYFVSSGFVTGWNYFKIKKSAFGTSGTGAWSGIRSMRIDYRTQPNAINTYISIGYIQLVKADPEDPSKPNVFQQNGKRVFTINSGEWFVGYELGKAVIKELGGLSVSSVLGLIGQNKYTNGTLTLNISGKTTSRSRAITAYVDGSNYVQLSNELDTLTLTVRVNGVSTPYTVSMPFVQDDLLTFILSIEDGIASATAYKNRDFTNPYLIGEKQFVTSEWSVAVGGYGNVVQTYESISATSIQHTHTSDISDVALNAVNAEAVGEVGIDNIVEYNPVISSTDAQNNTTLKAQLFTLTDVNASAIGLQSIFRHGINLQYNQLNGFNAQRLCTLNAALNSQNYAQHWRQATNGTWSEWFQELQTGRMLPVSSFTHVGTEGNTLNWTNPVSGQYLKTQIFRCETTDKMTGKASEILLSTSGVTRIYDSAGTGSGGANTFTDTYVPAEGTLLFYVIVALFEIGGATWYSPRKTLSYNYVTPTGYYLHQVGIKAGSWDSVDSATTDYVEDSQVNALYHVLGNLESVNYSLYDTLEFEAIRVSGTQSSIQFGFGYNTTEGPIQREDSADFSSWHLVTMDISELTATRNCMLTQNTHNLGAKTTVTYRYRNIRLYNA